MKKQTLTHTYQLKFGIYLLTSVSMPDGSETSVTFKDGFTHPFRYSGTFSTDDQQLIDAIEKDPRFGTEWKRIAPTYKNDRLQEDVSTPDNTGTPPQGEAEDTATDTEPPAFRTPVPEITSGQKARAYLLSTYDDLKSSDLRTNDAIKKVADDKGIFFPDWVE